MLFAVSTAFSADRSVSFWGGAQYEVLVTINLNCAACLLVSRYDRPVFDGAACWRYW